MEKSSGPFILLSAQFQRRIFDGLTTYLSPMLKQQNHIFGLSCETAERDESHRPTRIDPQAKVWRFNHNISLLVILLGSSLAFGQSANADPGYKPTKFAEKLAAAAIKRTAQTVIYDPSYRSIAYPGGDVPLDRGVCTDVVIRSYRALGIDLQERVHLDMRSAFRKYPRRWGLKRPDTNIDHRRVPNLRRFFIRKGASLPISLEGNDYQVGDLVTWDLGKPGAGLHPTTKKRPNRLTSSRTPHIGVVSDKRSADGKRPLIVHNIGRGTELSDMLFDFQITGRYRYPRQSSR